MNEDLVEIRKSVEYLLDADESNRTNITWLVGIFVSLRNAQEYGFEQDRFVVADYAEQKAILLRILDSRLPSEASEQDCKLWWAPHFFNNGLFRIVSLAEQRLEELVHRLSGRPLAEIKQVLKKDFPYLKTEYHKRSSQTDLRFLTAANNQANKMKHIRTQEVGLKVFEVAHKDLGCKSSLDLGIKAFEELLVLSRQCLAVKTPFIRKDRWVDAEPPTNV